MIVEEKRVQKLGRESAAARRISRADKSEDNPKVKTMRADVRKGHQVNHQASNDRQGVLLPRPVGQFFSKKDGSISRR